MDHMKIRYARAAEAEACNAFYNRIYGRDRTADQWRWDFTSSDFEAPDLPFVIVEDKGEIVGTQAFIPIRMIDKNGVFWTAKSEETLVDPRYRGQRLFEKMYRLLFDFARDHDLACVWGFTPATRAFSRLGFDLPGQTSQLFFPFSPASINGLLRDKPGTPPPSLSTRLALPFLRLGSLPAIALSRSRLSVSRDTVTLPGELRCETLRSAPEASGELTREFIRQFGGQTIYRDADYLRWRLFENPYQKSHVKGAFLGDKLVGLAAYAMGEDSMSYLVDILAVSAPKEHCFAETVTAVLLREAVDGTRGLGATGIRGWHTTGHAYDRLLLDVAEQIGFYRINRGHAVVLYINKQSDRATSLRYFDDWYVSRIYTEGVLG